MWEMKTKQIKWIYIVIGYFLASLIPALVFAVLTPLQEHFTVLQLGLVPVFFVFSAAAVALIGLPMYFTLRAAGLITWWSSLVAGCLGGAIVSIVIRLPSMPSLSELLIDCHVGAASALVFWAVLKAGDRAKT